MNEREIFEQAIDLTPTDRREYVARVCADDDGMRRRVERLLDAHKQTESILDRPATAIGDPDADAEPPSGGEADRRPFLAHSEQPESLGRLGHYEIRSCIGQGEFGIVFRAFDCKLHRDVAIKVLKPELAASSIARERFLREARSAALINHEHVVQVYSVEEHPTPYLVMEFVEGETLERRLRREGALAWPSVATLGTQIARGLAAAHARGLIHRDIKPGNILLCQDRSDFVKLTDFGLARSVDDAALSRSGVIIGTPRYMAPEQALGESITSQADLFSLGSVLYEMASGVHAFPGESLVAVLRAVALARPRPLEQIVDGLPTAFYDLVRALQARDPQQRWESSAAAATLEQLRDAARLEQTSDSSTATTTHAEASPNARSLPLAKRSAAFAAVIVVGLLAATGALGSRAGWFGEGQPAPRPPRSSSPAPGVSAAKATEPSSRPSGEPLDQRESADRRGARFVLSVGGKAVIRNGSDEQTLESGDELPAGDWQLVEVDLAGREGITNLGLQSFAGCRRLRRLTIQSSHVDGAGLDSFRGCDQLEALDLSRTKVGGAGLVVFQDCRQLRELRLAGAAVTDDDLVYFSGCKQLETLDLGETKVSTKSVRLRFANAPLKTLVVPRDLPFFARQELKRAFPDCEISFSSSRAPRKD